MYPQTHLNTYHLVLVVAVGVVEHLQLLQERPEEVIPVVPRVGLEEAIPVVLRQGP